jgi:ATP phosphoribosyltransferase
MSEKIIIAIPKGRILKELKPILEKAGIVPEEEFFNESTRRLMFSTNKPAIDLISVRSFDVATFVAFGAAQVGIAGSDVLEEFNYPDIYSLLDLNIGHCRLSVAAPADFAKTDNPSKWSHIRIATKYPETTRRHFASRGVQAECIKLNGAVELAPKLGLCRRIVDLVSSGATLKENGLVEIEKIMDVSSRLIVNRPSYKTRYAEISAIVNGISAASS